MRLFNIMVQRQAQNLIHFVMALLTGNHLKVTYGRLSRVIIATICLCFGCALFTSYVSVAQEAKHEFRDVRLLSGQPGGTSYAFGVALETLFHLKRNQSPHIRLKVQDASHSLTAIQSVLSGAAELAIVESDVARQIFEQQESGDSDQPVNELRLLAKLWPEPVHIIIKQQNARTDTISDLPSIEPRTVSMGNKLSFLHNEMPRALMALGYTQNDASKYMLDISASEGLRSFKENRIQALVLSGGLPLYTAQTALNDREDLPSLLNISIDQTEQINAANGSRWQPYTIPANTYASQPLPVQTMAQDMVLITSLAVPDDVIYEAMRIFHDNVSFLKALQPVIKNMTIDDYDRNLPIPLHQSALRFYTDRKNSRPLFNLSWLWS